MIRILLVLLVIISSIASADQVDGKIEIRKISENVFLHTSYKKLPNYGFYPSNGLVVIEGSDAYIIDTPWPEEDTPTLEKWIKDSGFSLKASISTHFHDDRTSGIAYLNTLPVKTYASALTNQILGSQASEKAAFEFKGEEFTLLDGVIYAYYPGAGHTQDNVIIWLPKSGILFGGCLLRSASSKNLGNTADASVSDWASSVQNVMNKFPSAKIVIPGHGEAGGFELLMHTKELAISANSK